MSSAGRRVVRRLGVVLAACCAFACRTVTEHCAAPPPELWLFVADDTSSFNGESAITPGDGEAGNVMPMKGYDIEGDIAVFATRSYGRSPLIMYVGYDSDDMVGYGRGQETVSGTNRGGRKGAWVKFSRLGGQSESPRVADAMARLGLDELQER